MSPPLTHFSFPPLNKSGLKRVCNVNIVYGNFKPENSQDYAQKPQLNCASMNSASVGQSGRYGTFFLYNFCNYCNYLVAQFSEKGKKGNRNVYFFHCTIQDISVSGSFLVRRIARGPVTGNEVLPTNIYTVYSHSPIQL
jgi:hypothetical protein